MLNSSGKTGFFKGLLLALTLAFTVGGSHPSVAGPRCAKLAEVKKIHLDPYNNGILTRTADGKLVFTYGCVMISHNELLAHAKQFYGEANQILWAGELQATGNTISVINETAGIMIRETPSIQSKVSDLGNLVDLYERHPRLRKFFSAEPKLIRFSETLPPEEMHLFQGLKDIARFRHDIQGATATFIALADGLEGEYLPDQFLREMSEPLKVRAKELLDLLTIAKEHGLGSRNPLDPQGTIIQKTLDAIILEGLTTSPEVNKERIMTIRREMEYFLAKEMKMFSILIESR